MVPLQGFQRPPGSQDHTLRTAMLDSVLLWLLATKKKREKQKNFQRISVLAQGLERR